MNKKYQGTISTKDVSKIHKVKYKNPKTIDEFQNVYQHLHSTNKVYYSNVAERKRTYIMKDDINLPKHYSIDKCTKIFKNIITSFLYNLKSDFTFENIKNQSYIYDKNNRMYMIEYSESKFIDRNEIPKKFSLVFIDKDIVYWENFYFTPNLSIFLKVLRGEILSSKISSFKIKYEKIIKTPFTMEAYNLQLNMAKRYMRKNFDITFNQILEGMKI